VLVEIARVKAVLEGAHLAEPLLRQALTMQRDTLVPGHRFLVPTLLGLGEVVRSRGGPAEAQGLFREAVDIARKSLPERHSLRRRAEAAVAPRS
jgi:Tetratricopeptide repeat